MSKEHGWDYGPPSVDKTLGSLPVVAEFSRRLDVAGTVDRLCPVRDVAVLSHGQVIEALIANRLTSPAPLLGVEDWAAEWAVAEVFGTDAGTLNDDRTGRALDAVAPHLDEIVGPVGARAITGPGTDVPRLYWDMTSISLVGGYPSPEAGFIEPSYGKPKDRRVDRKQLQMGLVVSGDGGVPVFHRAFDGKAGEVNQVIGAMEALKAMAAERKFLLVGGSKLVPYANLAAMVAAGVTFVGPAPKSYVNAEALAGCDITRAIDAGYVPERASRAAKSTEAVTYRAYEDTMVIAGPGKAGPDLDVRRVFVWSSGNATAAVTNRARKLAKAADELGRAQAGLGGRSYNNVAKVAAIGADRRVAAYLIAQIGTDETGRPTLTWSFDQTVLDAEAASDGWYAVLTNLGPDDAGTAEVLRRYKGPEVVERRYGDFKGPLAVAPMFLHNNRRTEALITVICLALLIFCLIEREVRSQLAPETTMVGIYPENRAVKPTGRLIFAALAGMRLTPATATNPPRIPRPNQTQLRLLDMLHVDPRIHR